MQCVTRSSVTPALGGAPCAALNLSAVSQEAEANAEEPLKEIIVTGSAIPRTGLQTVSPLTVISSEDVVASCLTTVSDVVRTLSADDSGSLPTAFPGAFAAGAVGVALRGLTVNSTLVLIDGLRAADYALPDDGHRPPPARRARVRGPGGIPPYPKNNGYFSCRD